jgi:glycosyltransferase involved in cell wall biosynthesis
VLFSHKPTPQEQGIGFGMPFEWDIDLTSGYSHRWLKNCSSRPSLTAFWGCDTPEIAELIRNGRFDAFLVHGWNNRSCWQAFWSCWRNGIPLLVRGDSQLKAQRSGVKRMIKRLVYPLFISRFQVCLATGERSADYFRHYKARRISLAPHFIDNNWFSARAATARRRGLETRSRWGVDQDTFVFLFVGKFEPKKRPLDVIWALSEAGVSQKQKMALVMVGDGALRPICEKTANESGIPVIFAGFLNQSEMPTAYGASDCLVLPSDARETWGLVVNEAMACGLPAIVSHEAGCVPDLIIEGRSGHSYPCGDIKALSDHMVAMACDRAYAGSLGAFAERHVQNYSVERAAEVILQSVEESVAAT